VTVQAHPEPSSPLPSTARRRRYTKRERIRTVFLRGKKWYTLDEAARLTGTRIDLLRREVGLNNRDAHHIDGEWHFQRRQLFHLALDRWTLAEIYDALGDDADEVLPPLLALRTIAVRLPEYVLRGMEAVAKERRMPLDQYLYWELIDFAGCLPRRFVKQIPGYRDAYLFPGRE
jgi:hypothetical protein